MSGALVFAGGIMIGSGLYRLDFSLLAAGIALVVAGWK